MSRSLKLNVFGDSYTTPNFCVAPTDSFWGLMAQKLNVVNIDNYSHPGFSLDHIVHIILNEDFNFEQECFIIGIPPLIRYIAYNDESKTMWHKNSFTLAFDKPCKTTIESLTNTQRFSFDEQFKNDKSGALRFNAEWNDVQCLEKIYLLHQYLTSKSAKFIIVNLSNPLHYQDLWPAGKTIMTKVGLLKECIIFDHTYYSVNYQDKIKPADFDQHGWQGHHGAEGNKNWYNKILEPKIKELGWINA